MGPSANEENRNRKSSTKNNDSNDVPTQRIDSQFSPGCVLEDEGADDFLYITDTMPVDDTYLSDSAFETQLVNLGGVTQVVDLGGETQVVDLAGETQVLDDICCVKNMPFEFLNELNAEIDAVSKCEETTETEAFVETQELSEDDSVKIDGSDLAGLESTVDNYPPKKGSFAEGFTSIRAASIRASGLAALARGANGNLRTTSSDKSSLEQEKCGEELNDSNKHKVGSTAVRKLFRDDEVDQSEADINHTDDNLDMPELFETENCSAGLSYANSQEPGELSQAHALEVVDRFLDLNVMENDGGFGMRGHNVEKPKVVSGAKGSRDLAKKSTYGECGIYDWDDTREDDGGGDFFLKKKELFFDKVGQTKSCVTEPRKSRCLNLISSVNAVGKTGDEKYTKNQLRGSVNSDPGLMLHKLRAKGKPLSCREEASGKNLIKDFDDQLMEVVSGPKLAENDTNKDILDMANIGPDTQLAAEAMETLCFEVAESNSKGSKTEKATKENLLSNRNAKSNQHLTPKRPYSTRVGVVTRQAKKIKNTSKNACSEPSLSPTWSKKGRCGIKRGEAEQSRLAGVNLFANHGTESSGQRSEKKCHLEDQLDFIVPIAHRTRKHTESNRSKSAVNSFGAGYRKRSAAKDKETLIGHEADKLYCGRVKRSRVVAENISSNPGRNHSNHSSTCDGPPLSSLDMQSEKTLAEGEKTNGRLEASPKERCGISSSTCITPAKCTTPISNVSPICMGDEYHKQSCRRSLSKMSLAREVNDIITSSPVLYGEMKGSRKRKDITNIRVLFSQHLDVDVTKQQKKILARLGGAVASAMSDATHFVADEFVRTRNMLEAIACGKPVVTHLWLESCGQASCLIDEKNYILRDARKEREFGFSLPVSISRACQYPLLQGQKVLVTPNTKPGKDILANLVKAVHGLAVERLGRSVLKDEKFPDDLLILSCEEDYNLCVPYLEKGASIYSSELLLNGIVKQKLEYERHRLFADHVRKTRSTIWLKKKNGFLPVTKCK